MRNRRSLSALSAAVDQAGTRHDRAVAHYNLALFHDNNGREAEAIPHYEQALALGLSLPLRAEALAWLASSLYKTGRPSAALERAQEALALTDDADLRGFLLRLTRRIARASGPPATSW
ncbi:MAG TPA: tetratricopeptide repeat protein [Chloroflexota bacterium]|nr:tetratricopeptide repeat protein [Chloroflexota bacterium]